MLTGVLGIRLTASPDSARSICASATGLLRLTLKSSTLLRTKAGRSSSFIAEISNIAHLDVPGVPGITAVRRCPGMPPMIGEIRDTEFERTTLKMSTRRSTPTGASSGPRMRRSKRMKKVRDDIAHAG